MTSLGLTDAADRKLKGGKKHAKALKEKHPTLSIATAAWLSGATEGTLRQDPAFQDEAGSAVQAEMTMTDAADRKLKGGKKHAKAPSDAEHRHRRLALRRHGGQSAKGAGVPVRKNDGPISTNLRLIYSVDSAVAL
jgi:hypothetical protein